MFSIVYLCKDFDKGYIFHLFKQKFNFRKIIEKQSCLHNNIYNILATKTRQWASTSCA